MQSGVHVAYAKIMAENSTQEETTILFHQERVRPSRKSCSRGLADRSGQRFSIAT